jgi:O-methyltransferase
MSIRSSIGGGTVKRLAKTTALRFGFRVQRRYPPDFDEALIAKVKRVVPFTQTTPEGIAATCGAVDYVVKHGIPGACVECGVWRGGSAMAIALTLRELGDVERDLHLFDTFEGMPEPGEPDVTVEGTDAHGEWVRGRRGDSNAWNYAPLDEVRSAVLSTGYPAERIHFVQGKVEDTLPAAAPDRIAVLRLDTDWYESTRHELVHLFPRLATGGVLIVDDYGFWAGARQATDEYFASEGIRIMLNRIDVPGRIGVKQDD